MQLSKKQLSIILAVVIITTCMVVSPIVYVIAASPSRTVTLGAGQYPGAPSYTIYSYSGTYYAKDQNGYEEFSGANATAIMDSLISSVSDGETILLSSDLAIDSFIHITKGITVEGNGHTITATATTTFMLWSTVQNVTFNNIKLNGAGLASYGFSFSYDSSNGKVLNCEVSYTLEYGISVVANSVPINNMLIFGNYVHHIGGGTYGGGIKFGLGGGDQGGVGNRIINNVVNYVAEHGIKLYSVLHQAILSGNSINHTGSTGITVEGTNTRVVDNIITYTEGMGLSVGSAGVASYCYVGGNIIAHQITANYGIAIWGNNCAISNNQVVGYSTAYYLSGVDYNVLMGNMADGAGTAIWLKTGCNYNLINGFSQRDGIGAIYEEGTSDYNVFIGSVMDNPIYTVGANTEVYLWRNATS